MFNFPSKNIFKDVLAVLKYEAMIINRSARVAGDFPLMAVRPSKMAIIASFISIRSMPLTEFRILSGRSCKKSFLEVFIEPAVRTLSGGFGGEPFLNLLKFVFISKSD